MSYSLIHKIYSVNFAKWVKSVFIKNMLDYMQFAAQNYKTLAKESRVILLMLLDLMKYIFTYLLLEKITSPKNIGNN